MTSNGVKVHVSKKDSLLLLIGLVLAIITMTIPFLVHPSLTLIVVAILLILWTVLLVVFICDKKRKK